MTLLHLTIGIFAILWIILTYHCIKDGMNDYGSIDEDIKFINFAINAFATIGLLVWLVSIINWDFKIL